MIHAFACAKSMMLQHLEYTSQHGIQDTSVAALPLIGLARFSVDGRLVYEWEQDLTDVHMFLHPPPQTRAKEIAVRICPNKLCVGLVGKPPLFDEELSSTVDTSASFWMLEDGELHIQLGKMRKGEVWKSALKGHAPLNAVAAEEVQKKLMLERFGEEASSPTANT
ncbi:hypothetical protein ACSSS7_002630 [Eimeria intestinalis]